LIRRLFGKKGEGIDPAQLELLFSDMPGKPEASDGAAAPEEAAPNAAEPVRTAKKRAAHRSRITGLENLPCETTEIIPDLVAADPAAFERIGEEVTELLDITPAKFFKRRIIRAKFRRKESRHLPPIVAPAPATPLVGGLPAPGLLAHLLVGKYIDHLPLYRQQSIFHRHGIGLPRDLIVHWIQQSINLLEPVAQAIRAETLASSYLQLDETPVRYLVPGSGKAHQGYLWVASVPGGSLFYHWGIGRGQDQLIETLGGNFRGDIQCDGYGAYKAHAKANSEARLIACLAHIRRNFVEALEADSDQHAARIVRLIAHLYRIEKDLRESKAGPALRESERAWRSAPIVARIKATMKVALPKHRPQSLVGQALGYGLRHWDTFARYLEDGRFEIDNNLVENAIRPIKLGAKNWLFFGSKEAGHQAAAIYTIVENCKRHGVPVEAYLQDLLTRLPTTNDEQLIATLTPARVAAARRRKSEAA
jgi:transposase